MVDDDFFPEMNGGDHVDRVIFPLTLHSLVGSLTSLYPHPPSHTQLLTET